MKNNTSSHFRDTTLAHSSSVCPTGLARLTVDSARAYSTPATTLVIGRVIDSITGTPVSDAVIEDEKGTRVARSLINGCFKVERGSSSQTLSAHSPGYNRSAPVSCFSTESDSVGSVTIRLAKSRLEIGDVVESVFCGDLMSIGFLADGLWGLRREGDGDDSVNILRRIMPADNVPEMVLRTGVHPIGSFVLCGERVVGVGAWPGRFYEIRRGSLMEIQAPCSARSQKPIAWPGACTWDGELLWFLETDRVTPSVALHAYDLALGKTKVSLPSADTQLVGLAWDQQLRQFWVSSLKGSFYSIRLDIAMQEKRLEPARGREFQGDYGSLAAARNYLWGFDPKGKKLCKIKIRDTTED